MKRKKICRQKHAICDDKNDDIEDNNDEDVAQTYTHTHIA